MTNDKIRRQAERIYEEIGDEAIGRTECMETIERILREPDFDEMFAKWHSVPAAGGGPSPGASLECNCQRAMIFGWKQAKGDTGGG